MKTLITSLFILLASTIFSQSDGLIHYQVVTENKGDFGTSVCGRRTIILLK